MDRTRHRVAGGVALSDRQTPKPQDEPEFRHEHEDESDTSHPEAGRRHGRHSESQNWLFVVKKRRPPEGRPITKDPWSASTKLSINRL